MGEESGRGNGVGERNQGLTEVGPPSADVAERLKVSRLEGSKMLTVDEIKAMKKADWFATGSYGRTDGSVVRR